MKTNAIKRFMSVLAAVVCLGWTAQARAFGTDGGGALEQLGVSASEIPFPVQAANMDLTAAGVPPAYSFKAGNSKNTLMDRLHSVLHKVREKVYGTPEKLKTDHTTQEASDITLRLIAAKLTEGRNFTKDDVPMTFQISSNNMTRQYRQGNGFSKLKELIEKAEAAGRSGITAGVFIVGHNFMVSEDETGRKMAELLISAKTAGVPVLLSYDHVGTSLYKKGAPVIKRLKDAGIGLLETASLRSVRPDHRKIFFIGAGDGHVICLAGGQNWAIEYSGKGWDKSPALTNEEAGQQNGTDDETWMDQMRLLDGEAALQGALHFIGCFASQAGPSVIASGLGLGRDIKAGSERVKQALESVFAPRLVKAGDQQAAILTNMNWDNRPLTEVWYNNLSDPDIKEIRIAMPYITDPVFRTKLRQAVRDGKDLKILIPGLNDSNLAQMAAEYQLQELVDLHERLARKGWKTGRLELREWQTKDGKPMMIHLKCGIFIHKVHSSEDTVLDGSYNATALEGRVVEKNADVMLKGRESALQAAYEFDGLFEMAKKYESSPKSKAGLAALILLRMI